MRCCLLSEKDARKAKRLPDNALRTRSRFAAATAATAATSPPVPLLLLLLPFRNCGVGSLARHCDSHLSFSLTISPFSSPFRFLHLPRRSDAYCSRTPVSP